ncbi:MAG: hypothetical protein V1752_05105 [Candidatus Firestonebacteria bacterium]
MKKIVLLLWVLCTVFLASGEGQEFKWVRVQFKCKEADAQEKWDHDKKSHGTFLKYPERYSILKVNKTWNVITLEKIK